MPLSIGDRLGPYELVDRIGAGGFGEIFKARDTRLHRIVALKVLRHDRVVDAERTRRFLQEARAVSALNHPNIVTLHDIANDAGVDFLVMEYVSGGSLDKLISGKGLPLAEAIRYAEQIASALAAAHAIGIVHRDIKPQNVIVTSESHVKVLDFGLAKLGESVTAGSESETRTQESALTETGKILGTVAYMSPEQAQGKPVDARSDIFSFGALLYEMLTGRRAFRGENMVSTLAAILHTEPAPLREVVENAPPELSKLLARCLRKDPAQRMQSIADVRLLLEETREAPAAVSTAAPLRKGSRLRWPLVITGALAAGAGLAAILFSERAPDLSSYRLRPVATEAAAEQSPVWSPDGRTLAYTVEVNGVRQVYTRALDALVGTRVTNSPAACNLPFWSRDGGRIYYLSGGNLWSIGGAGGVPQLAVRDVVAATISPDGKTLAFSRGKVGSFGLWIASPIDAEPKLYREPPFPQNAGSVAPPVFSPDGSKIAVAVARQTGASQPGLWLVPYPSGKPRRAMVQLPQTWTITGRGSWLPDNRHLVIAGSMGDMDPQLYMLDTARDRMWPLTASPITQTEPNVSPDGRRIAFTSGTDDYDLLEFSMDGSGKRTVLATSRSEQTPAWSPTGGQYAYGTNANVAPEIWLRSMSEDSARPLVKQDSASPAWYGLIWPRFSPDGQRISYDIYGRKHQVAISSVAGGQPIVLDQESPDQHGGSWSPDGNWLAYRRLNAGKWELVKTPVGGGKPVFLSQTRHAGGETDWSPTGEWICHFTDEGMELVSPDGKGRHTLTGLNATTFGFARDGATLYVVRRNKAQRWELAALTVPEGREKNFFPLDVPVAAGVLGFSVHPQGHSFLTSVMTPRHDIWILEGFPQPRRWAFFR
jgi:serine/threonine protein kinase/Tol biopolymer transport system component